MLLFKCLTIVTFTEILAAGTSHGRIAMWRMVVQPGNSRGDSKAQWKLQTPTEIEGNITQLQVLSELTLIYCCSIIYKIIILL